MTGRSSTRYGGRTWRRGVLWEIVEVFRRVSVERVELVTWDGSEDGTLWITHTNSSRFHSLQCQTQTGHFYEIISMNRRRLTFALQRSHKHIRSPNRTSSPLHRLIKAAHASLFLWAPNSHAPDYIFEVLEQNIPCFHVAHENFTLAICCRAPSV